MDDEAVWGWGLGCNGAIDVLVEPASGARPYMAAMRAARREHRSVALVTVVEGPRTGDRLIIHPDGSTQGDLGVAARSAALEALATGRSAGRSDWRSIHAPIRRRCSGSRRRR